MAGLNLDIMDLLLIAGILFMAAMAQSAVGFGYGLFATPLLVAVGLPIQYAIVLVLTCSLVQSTMGAVKLREHVPWKTSFTAVALRMAAVIFGVFLLRELVGHSAGSIRMVIGIILCCLVMVQLFLRPKPVKQLHWGWAGISFSTSGILAGLCGMGGPPLVIWSMAHDWTPLKTRGFLFSVFAMCLPMQLTILAITFGPKILWFLVMGLCYLPLVYFGNRIGLPIGNRMAKERLKMVAYAILFVIGVAAIVPSLVSQ